MLYLVACAAGKVAWRAPAKDLYDSALFSKSRAWVEAQGKLGYKPGTGVQPRPPCWYILSAKHGLVHPDTELDPYEKTLNNMSKKQREAWADEVQQQIDDELEKGRIIGGDRGVTLLAGQVYTEDLMPYLEETFSEVIWPMKGLKIGQQLSWLTTNGPSPPPKDKRSLAEGEPSPYPTKVTKDKLLSRPQARKAARKGFFY